MTVDELQVLITANTEGLRNEISGVKGQLNNLTSSTNKMGNNMVKNIVKGSIVTKALCKTFQLLSSNMGDAVSRLDTLNNFPRVMGNLGISGEDAQKSIDYLSAKLQNLPTTLDDAASSVQRLTAANGNIQASTKMFLAMNNAILAGGSNMQTQQSALEQLSQAYSKGKPDMMEWRTMMTAMPAQLKQVGIAMGYASADQLGEALRNGSVSMNDFMKTMVELNQNGANGFESFADQAESATGGVQTSIANMKTAITRGLANIMDAIGQSNIAGFFKMITHAIDTATNYVVAFVKVMVTAVGYISKLFGGKGIKNSAKDTNKASSALGNLGTSGSSASKGMDKASGSAKKLKKELNGLASFDEMNVLNENKDNDSGSGGSGGGAGGADMSGIDLGDFGDFDTANSKVDELYESMMDKFTKVKDLLESVWNSEPIQSFVGFAKTYGDFLYDFWSTIGTDLWNNLSMTWSNIEDNLSNSLSNMSELFTLFWQDLQEGLTEWGQPFIDGVSGLFNSVWQDAIDPAVQIAAKIWEDFTKILLDFWKKHGKPIVDEVGEFVTNIVKLFQKIWDDVLEPIITPFLETLSWLWDKHIKGLVEEVTDFVGELIECALKIYNKFIQPIITNLLDKLSPAWSFLSNLIIGVLGTILGTIADVVGGIIKYFKGVIQFITGIFTGDWKKAWEGVKNMFSGVIKGLAGIFKTPINVIIDGINSFIAGINHIKIPDWVPAVGGKGFNIKKIPKLALGGVVDRPTYALVGESGKEAVMPLENNTAWMDMLAEKIDGRTTGGNIVVKIGEDTIYNKVINEINRKSFETNGMVFNV